MSDKKTTMIHVRIPEDEKKFLEILAKEKMTDVSKLMRDMAGRLVIAHRKHGNLLVWPPEFDYIPAGTQTAFEARKTPKPQKISSSTEKKKAGERAA